MPNTDNKKAIIKQLKSNLYTQVNILDDKLLGVGGRNTSELYCKPITCSINALIDTYEEMLVDKDDTI